MKIRLVMVAAMLVLAACDNTTARYSSDFATQLSEKDILILPVYAEAYKVDSSGNEDRQYDYEGYIEPIIADVLRDKLEEKGYRVRLLHKKDLANHKTYREYDNFRAAFKTAYEEDLKRGAVLKRDAAKSSVITLNGKATALSKKTKAPLLAYVDYNETDETADVQVAQFIGAVLIGALTGVNSGATPPDKAMALVAIIDGENDKVLWMNRGGSAGGGFAAKMMFTDDEQARDHIDNSLKWALRELPDRADLFKKDE